MGVWIAAIAALAGACIGSFLNVVIHRLQPEGFLRLGPRSVCPACGARIAWFDNLPVVSYALLRGKARCCAAKISARYPLVEVLTAGLAILSVRHRGVTALDQTDRLALVAVDLLFVSLMVALSFIDLRDRLLPDVLTIPGIVAGILLGALLPELHAGGLLDRQGLSPSAMGFVSAALGSAAGAAIVWVVGEGGRLVFKREAMGYGDVKFMGFAGAFVGADGVLIAFFLGCLLGALVGTVRLLFTRDPYIPFGPFLAVGALVAWFWKREFKVLVTDTLPGVVFGSTLGIAAMLAVMALLVAVLVVLRRRRRNEPS